MDPPREGFEALERALQEASFTSNHDRRVSSSNKHDTTHARPNNQATVSHSAEPESPLVSPLSNDEDDIFDVSVTPPQQRQTGLVRHNSGLPPTPPTMTNSDVAEAKIDRSLSPLPLFADRVRNALESQKSGISTPTIENHSPPTPDPSPRVNLPTLSVPRPELAHQMSTQSQAESFQTATEGYSIHDITSDVDLPARDPDEQAEQRYLRTPKPTRALSSDSRSAFDALGLSDQSDVGEARRKTYHFESDTDGERVRTKNYQAESDSEVDKASSARPVSSAHTTKENSPTSPSLRKVLNHRAAYQQRLWKPIQPGDAIKRPDAALLYGSTRPWKQPNGSNRDDTQPRREMDTEFLRNAEELAASQSPELIKPASPEPQLKPEPNVGSQFEESKPSPMPTPVQTPSNLREFAPFGAPPDPTPPTTAQKASLDENNLVYRMIREENVKRHSGISDGSVQAVVVPVPTHKRKLRHTQKRESLRGDASMEANSKRSSTESGHKLKHMKATIDNNDMGFRSIPQPRSAASQGEQQPAPHSRSKARTTLIADSSSPSHSKRSKRFDGAQAGPGFTSIPTKDGQVSARISNPAANQNGKVHRFPIPDAPAVDTGAKPQAQSQGASVTEFTFRPRKLRRSLRENSIDRTSPAPEGSETRPLSMDGSSQPQVSDTPKLRRTSQEKRLDKNHEVRRTSLSHEPRTVSQSIDTKLDLVADDLTREGRGMRDRTSATTKERHTSADRSFHSATSPRRKSFDPRHLHPVGTPYSTSQFSDRTEAELLEARGVELFPHNNESLLIVQQASQAISRPIPIDVGSTNAQGRERAVVPQTPVFEAHIQEPQDALDDIGKPKYGVDSPLTNPRAAPQPPVIMFIPPTPNEELERPLQVPNSVIEDPRNGLQRRLSLSQRVRRYSESLIQPLPFGRNGSVRKREPKRITTMSEARPTYLSSFWQPRDFWEEYDSDEDSDDFEPLPRGGDTSDVTDRRRAFFPRNMSVRMPGFRGTGGFLVGNSLGLDRHGTNNRRHYVARRTSEEMMRRLAESKRRRTFTVPFSRGTKVEYVGLAGLGARLRQMKQQRQARALEKRREKLRGQIGTRLYHDGRCGVP